MKSTAGDTAAREVRANLNVLVVGGTGALGRAVCSALAADGHGVFVSYRGNLRAGQEVLDGLPAGSRLGVGRMDLTDRPSIARLRRAAVRAAGRVDAVVFASGAEIAQPLAAEASEQAWREVVDTELMGFINLTREFVPVFRAQRRGSFVGIVTYANYSFPIGDSLSSVPKAGIEALTRALAKEEGRNGIRANCVAPGIINAGLGAQFQKTLYNSDVWERQRRNVPLRRFGEASEVADAVVFLLSDKATYVTGCTLLVDGGLHL